jgi:hypothetical protein
MKTLTNTQGVRIMEAERLRHGVVLYGQVLSTDGHTWYAVKKERAGRDRFTYRCACLGNFLGGAICRHIEALKQVEAKR